jgi:hypothetical protein
VFYLDKVHDVEGDAGGDTITTKAVETSDDPGGSRPDIVSGTGAPLLARHAVPVSGVANGVTVTTRALPPETIDDEPGQS